MSPLFSLLIDFPVNDFILKVIDVKGNMTFSLYCTEEPSFIGRLVDCMRLVGRSYQSIYL